MQHLRNAYQTLAKSLSKIRKALDIIGDVPGLDRRP
jgi:hypothetical protein